jgi:hypothetical protein
MRNYCSCEYQFKKYSINVKQTFFALAVCIRSVAGEDDVIPPWRDLVQI